VRQVHERVQEGAPGPHRPRPAEIRGHGPQQQRAHQLPRVGRVPNDGLEPDGVVRRRVLPLELAVEPSPTSGIWEVAVSGGCLPAFLPRTPWQIVSEHVVSSERPLSPWGWGVESVSSCVCRGYPV
ncbi:unnamed protein product, partial [Ectocarpus sp. 8 AP-2014]